MAAIAEHPLQVAITSRETAELVSGEPDARPLAGEEIAGRTCVSLISAGTELAACYQGERFPAYPGYAAVFEVTAIGLGVTRFRPGDLALCMGPHRSWQRAREADALAVPQGLDAQSAVFARMMGVSMSTLATTTARPGQCVLVTGLGTVGNLAAQIFTQCGYDVVAVDPSVARRDWAAGAGISNVHAAVPLETLQGKVALAVECSGRESATLDACRVVRKRGEVVLAGVPWKRTCELSSHELLSTVFHNYVVLRSGWEWELPAHNTDFRTGSISENYAMALRWLAAGKIRVDGLHAKVAPAGAQSAYQGLLQNSWPALSAVFDWRL